MGNDQMALKTTTSASWCGMNIVGHLRHNNGVWSRFELSLLLLLLLLLACSKGTSCWRTLSNCPLSWP
jgi:hypothetical protein